jgi:hypothetical protein
VVLVNAFLVSTPDGGKWLALHLGRFISEEILRYQLDRRLGDPQSRSALGSREENTTRSEMELWSFIMHSPH